MNVLPNLDIAHRKRCHAIRRAQERLGRYIQVDDVERRIKAGRGKRVHQTSNGHWIYKVRLGDGEKAYVLFDGAQVLSFYTQEIVREMKEKYAELRHLQKTAWRMR